MEIEFEVVTLRLPKAVVDYVRRMCGDPVKRLEWFVVDWIRIDVEVKTVEELVALFNLGPAFQAILSQS